MTCAERAMDHPTPAGRRSAPPTTPSSVNAARRRLLTGTLAAATLPALAACSGEVDAKEVGAVEDLMREHGILRRVLLVYTESIPKLRVDAASLDASALNK